MKCQYIKFPELGILNYLYKTSIFKLNFKTDSGFIFFFNWAKVGIDTDLDEWATVHIKQPCIFTVCTYIISNWVEVPDFIWQIEWCHWNASLYISATHQFLGLMSY